jgi:hypothetical protein
LDVGARAVREVGDLAESDALGLDLVEGLAAVKHGFVEACTTPVAGNRQGKKANKTRGMA